VKTRKHILTFFLLTLFLIFLKSDFRIINELRCCQDDFDYYSHALTIAQDFDLDYDNQITSKARFFNESSQKVAPMGFFGSGLLASPFLFLGVVLDNILNIEQEFLNYKKLMYSFSSIFYLFISSILLHKTLVNSEKKFSINLALFGSGIIYFAFERYSMTHAYEVFTVSLVIYFSDKFYRQDSKNKLYSILLPIAILLGFLVRWTNYYIVLIPLIISYFIKYKKHKEKLDIYLIVSTIFSILIFALHTKAIYGYVTFSPLDPAKFFAPVSTFIPVIDPFEFINSGIVSPEEVFCLIVSSYNITPPIHSFIEEDEKRVSLNFNLLLFVDSIPTAFNLFVIVAVLSSAANMPFPFDNIS